MIVLFHVLCALASLIFTSYMYLSPSHKKLRISYYLVCLTLGSGFYLVISTGSNILQSCLAGLAYLTIVLAGILLARHKLAAVRPQAKDY